ncbi:MAG: hypothetical protein LBD29_04145 [Treponema sp.]|nr:hypothetical protein [Treponema sp.]
MVSIPLVAQISTEQLLNPLIIENFMVNAVNINRAFGALHTHQNERFAEYISKVVFFTDSFFDLDTLLDLDARTVFSWNEQDQIINNVAKAYRKALVLYVPPEIKAVYRENGLGNRGHQVLLCLVLGIRILALKEDRAEYDQPLPKAKKTLSLLESLIHPKDLALIQDYWKILENIGN